MGINIDVTKIGKNTKFITKEGWPYPMIDWKEDGDGEFIFEKDEFSVGTERSLSFLILDNLVGEYDCRSNETWYIPLNFEMQEHWKRITMSEGSVWKFYEFSDEMNAIVEQLMSAKTFYDFAKVIKDNDLCIGGF